MTEFVEEFANPRNILYVDNETRAETISKLTHLYFNGKKINDIGDLELCRTNLRVLYLHNNAIGRIMHVNHLSALTHLYLQNNCIEKITGLERLPNLRKLFLGMNRIKVLENLNDLPQLRELHIERQRLETGEEFYFDADCVAELAGHIQLLNIGNLQLSTLNGLTQMSQLKQLLAPNNAFKCTLELGKSLSNFPRLQILDLHGCPAQNSLYYKEHILGSAPQIQTIDGKEIPRITRNSLKNFAIFKSHTICNQDKRPSTTQTRRSIVPNRKPSIKCSNDIVLSGVEEACHQTWSALKPNWRAPPLKSMTDKFPFGKRIQSARTVVRSTITTDGDYLGDKIRNLTIMK